MDWLTVRCTVPRCTLYSVSLCVDRCVYPCILSRCVHRLCCTLCSVPLCILYGWLYSDRLTASVMPFPFLVLYVLYSMRGYACTGSCLYADHPSVLYAIVSLSVCIWHYTISYWINYFFLLLLLYMYLYRVTVLSSTWYSVHCVYTVSTW